MTDAGDPCCVNTPLSRLNQLIHEYVSGNNKAIKKKKEDEGDDFDDGDYGDSGSDDCDYSDYDD